MKLVRVNKVIFTFSKINQTQTKMQIMKHYQII